MSKKCLGLDIGYSNVIGVFGDASETPTTIVYPARAVPLSVLPGDAGLREGEVVVDVDGTEWVAFAAPGRLQDGRELHEDYSASPAYQALFKASLLHAAGEGDVVDRLVTGLPVHQARDTEYVQTLVKRMQGTHKITPNRTITVHHVEVVAQPIGTLTDIYCNTEYADVLGESVTLALDPGFFSVDWVLFDHQELVETSSNSSVKAMSVILQKTCDEIARDHGGNPGVEKVEHALQTGKNYVLLFGRKIELAPYLKRATDQVVPGVIADIKQSLRFLKGRAVDCIVYGGGGASFFAPYAAAEYPDAMTIHPRDSVISNAYGFWHMAQG